jgi:hypothetical protein
MLAIVRVYLACAAEGLSCKSSQPDTMAPPLCPSSTTWRPSCIDKAEGIRATGDMRLTIRRKSRFSLARIVAGAGFLAALSACVGPDLEPPFQGDKGTVGSTDTPSPSAGTAAPSLGANGGSGGASAHAPDAGVADEDAGLAR